MDDTIADDQDDDADDMSMDRLNQFAYDLTAEDAVAFQRRGSSLLVGFEVVEDADVALKSHRARLHELAEDMEWSHLSLVSRGRNLFRAPEVITLIDALADGTLFDQFDEVLFFGAGAGAHAAICYALAAPTARVVALAPLVGLDGATGPQDARMDLIDGIDVSARYGPTPDNLDTASDIFVVLDAAHAGDMAQAAALRGARVQTLVCRDIGAPLDRALSDMGVLDDLLGYAMEGSLTPAVFYAGMRIARRDNAAYLRRLTARLIEKDRKLLEALAVRNIARRTGRKRFARRFEQLESALGNEGVTVPPARPEP